jgi:hypothetical protein
MRQARLVLVFAALAILALGAPARAQLSGGPPIGDHRMAATRTEGGAPAIGVAAVRFLPLATSARLIMARWLPSFLLTSRARIHGI